MPDETDFLSAPDAETQDLLSHTGGGSVGTAEAPETPEPQVELPGAAEPAPQPTPRQPIQASAWEASPLRPLIDHLPGGLKRRIAAGEITAEDAVVRHYGSRKWSELIRTQDSVVPQLKAENQRVMDRLGAMMKKLQDTLGVQLEDEQQEPKAPDPMAQLHTKMDAVLQAEEDRRIEAVVDQVQGFNTADREHVLAEHPYLPEAEAFMADQILSAERTAVLRELELFNATRDTRYLQGIDRELLRMRVNGELDDEQLIEAAAASRAQDGVAVIMQRHFDSRTSFAQETLQMAQRLGWKPGQQPAAGGYPVNGSGGGPSPVPRRPAPARLDPALAKVRANMHHTPAPANSSGLSPEQAAQVIASMDAETFDQMMAAADDPKAMIAHIQKLGATLHSN